MKKKLLLISCCALITLIAAAQASGGQITRKAAGVTRRTVKKEVKRRNPTGRSETSSQQYSVPPPPPNIQPTPIENLSTYNVVVGTMSILGNAQGLCQSLRDKGYSSRIYWDEDRKLYRIIIGSTYSEQEALTLRSTSNQTYPGAWILYVVNGKEERYF